jgi:thiol-disulfide isomerase/thioredoxin
MKSRRAFMLIAMVIVLVVGITVVYKVGKRVVKAYEDYDATQIKDRGVAPELVLTDNHWVNTDKPIKLSDLRGQVVLLDFWRIECPECYASLPFLEYVKNKYDGKGLKLVSIHFPETFAERNVNNVLDYIKREKITYPVGFDPDKSLWNQYDITAAPTFLLIDREGKIRYRHIGQGRFDRVEEVIQSLLAEPANLEGDQAAMAK